MNEKLLQFIWRFQYFNRQQLCTAQGETIHIEKPGILNLHQGPDFSEAVIRIGQTKWVGNVELHLLSSDWYKHKHGSDRNYSNIILHVVWEEDEPVYDAQGNLFPTLALHQRVPKILLERYAQMMETMVMIPCHSFLPAIEHLAWCAWKERLAAERLERRSEQVLNLFRQSNCNWEETYWWMLAANFGIKVNSALFELVAKTLPVTLLAKHRNQIHQLEALLLGQANLLSGKYKDHYAVMLQKEYVFLKKKYGLQTVGKQPAFLRMRPAAFPTVRFAQLAMLLHTSSHLFALLKEEKQCKEVIGSFMVTANDYWNDHYRFDEETAHQPKHLGKQMAENILINTVVPVLFAYGMYGNDARSREKAIRWLYELPAEKNAITRQWQALNISNRSSLDSQALIELTNHYCLNKRCLGCAVGNGVLGKLGIRN